MEIEQAPNKSRFWEVWIIKQNNNTIGICGLYSLNNKVDTLWLGWLGILPALRNQKLGCYVLDFLKETAIKIGATKIMSYVDSNGKPLPFYIRNKFKVIGTVGDYIKENNMDISDFENEKDYIIECNL